jgi:hypothetical protein
MLKSTSKLVSASQLITPISLTGDVTLSTGNLVIGTSGKGIDFSATAGTGTSELLADYEEGTFTPIIIGLSSAGTGTYTTQVGSYTKVGNLVTVAIAIVWTAHTGTGNMAISSLPFTAATATSREWMAIPEFVNMTMPVTTLPFAYIANAGTNIRLTSMALGSGATTALAMDASASIFLSLTYLTA